MTVEFGFLGGIRKVRIPTSPAGARASYFIVTVCTLAWFGAGMANAWDYEGHSIINRLAMASLPADFPAFVRATAAEQRVAFLAGEPDRWRNSADLSLRHVNGPDHYIDLEELSAYRTTNPKSSPKRFILLTIVSSTSNTVVIGQ